ncbi:MAG: 23S rRNA (pseudouridine(1915)-N(3))-methyltransferase RlmH [Kiloniellaceae bacterium]
MALRITIAAAGRLRAGPEQDLFRTYAGRLSWPLETREISARPGLDGEALKAAEAALLSRQVPAGAVVVVLDERGQQLSSPDFAARLGQFENAGRRDIAFLIGGAAGLAGTLREEADLVLSLGPMTWPHLLARGLLAEQLYRAQQILAGHPYHKA